MKCPRCKNQSVLLEALGDGKTRIVCQKCGFNEVRDKRGCGLLTDDMPRINSKKLIMS